MTKNLTTRPRFIDLVVPVTSDDVENGSLDHLAQALGERPGFKQHPPSVLREAVAAAFGYSSWEAMIQRQVPVSGREDLPDRIYGLTDVMAWRLYSKGFGGPFRSLVAAIRILKGSKASIRLAYDGFGSAPRRTGGMHDNFKRYDAGLRLDEASPETALDPARDHFHRSDFQGDALDVVNRFWTPDCGITKDRILADLVQDSYISFDEMADFSGYSSTWPPGLFPTQYLDTDHKLVGYGWELAEIGGHHGSVFKGLDGLRKSCAAFWRRAPTAELAMTNLPPTLIRVNFENPFQMSIIREDLLDEEIAVSLGTAAEEAVPGELDIVSTDGRSLQVGEGVRIDIDGEQYIRPKNELPPSSFDKFGFSPLSREEVRELGGYADQLHEKVPLAFSEETYDTVCRVNCTLERMGEVARRDLVMPVSAGQLSSLVAASSLTALGSQAYSSDVQLQGASLYIAREVAAAGAAMQKTYPELAALSAAQLGEYGLAFYGKNGLRHDRAHAARNAEFLAYSFLRNLSLTPDLGSFGQMAESSWGVFSVLRRYVEANPEVISDASQRREFEHDARAFQSSVADAADYLNKFDTTTTMTRVEYISHPAWTEFTTDQDRPPRDREK